MLGIMIMINDYFHDLSVAVFLCAILILLYFAKRAKEVNSEEAKDVLNGAVKLMERTAWISFVFIILLGIVRAVTYKQYEWNTAVAHGQVAALIIKHVILVSIIVYGLYALVRYRRGS